MWVQGWTSERTEQGIIIADGSGASEPSWNLLDILFTLSDEDFEGMRVNFAWSVDEFVAPVIRLLRESDLKQLVHEHFLKIAGYGRIQYIPGKLFAVYEGEDSGVFFYSLNQYFPEIEDPKDANKIWGMADILVRTLNGMGIYAKSFTSPAKIYEQGILYHCDIPTAYDVPKEAQECVEYAWHCAGRPWIECFQIGYFDETFDYDQTAAYSAQMAKLQNTKHAKFQKSSTMLENADWGFLKGTISINPEVKVHPFTRRLSDGSIINSGGSWDDYYTLDSIKFLYQWGVGTFRLTDGWFLKFTSPYCPMEQPMKKLYNYRGQAELRDRLAKRMANGGIGKLLEEHKRIVDGKEVTKDYGPYFNPMWGSMMQERTKLEDARFIYVNKLRVQDLVAVNTDGVLSTKDVGMKMDKPKKMGGWRLTDIGPAIAESSGNVFHADKKPHGVTYDLLLDAIEAKPNEPYYNIIGTRMVTINDIVENKADWPELGKEKTFATSSIDLVKLMVNNKLGKLDRRFTKIPQTGRELLDNVYPSEPLILS
jgi:hypothetical protein